MVRVFSTQVDVVKQTISSLSVDEIIASSESIEFIDAGQTGNVASGGYEDTVVTPPAGYIYRMLALRIDISADADATSGTHEIQLRDGNGYVRVLYGISAYTTDIKYQYGYWQSADDTQYPPTDENQMEGQKTLQADETVGFELRYRNNTDAAQENDRNIWVLVRKIKVA